MGKRKKIKELLQEFQRDPHGQYFKHLDKLLGVGLRQGISKDKIKKHVEDW